MEISDYKGKTVGYQGTTGSYSEHALIEYFGEDIESSNVQEFEDVFIGLEDGSLDYGILPIENSSAGSVLEVYDLLRKYDFSIVGERCVKIEHNLLALQGSSLEDIKEVYSHPQALEQCREYLRSKAGIKLIPTLNTATSAEYIKNEGDITKAAIASTKAGNIYGLKTLASSINHNDNNYTRFIIVAKNMDLCNNADKVSIVFSTDHKPGALFNVLSYFADEDLNLLKIESRPIINNTWEYFFYIYFQGNIGREDIDGVIGRIKNDCTYFHLLGNYARCVEY